MLLTVKTYASSIFCPLKILPNHVLLKLFMFVFFFFLYEPMEFSSEGHGFKLFYGIVFIVYVTMALFL